jgi:GT2 family glycosyltransferase
VLYVYEEKLYEDLDGFDEDCFMYSDDIDCPYRACNWKENFYLADTTVIHYKGKHSKMQCT